MSRDTPISALRHRVILEAPQRISDGGGGANETWVQVAAIWAAITPNSGREAFHADRLTGQVSYEIRIRYLEGVTPDMRFRFNDRTFQILALRNIEGRGRWLSCLCEERDL